MRNLQNEPQIVTKKSPEEALAILLNNTLKKSVYQNMKIESKMCGEDIWPSYNEVRMAKALCRPPEGDVIIAEKKNPVTLQSLLSHTAERVVELQ